MFDCVGPAWDGRGYCVGLAASEFRLEADMFLLLGNSPGFLLLSESAFLSIPCLVLEAIIFLSLIMMIRSDMGIELCRSDRSCDRGGQYCLRLFLSFG